MWQKGFLHVTKTSLLSYVIHTSWSREQVDEHESSATQRCPLSLLVRQKRASFATIPYKRPVHFLQRVRSIKRPRNIWMTDEKNLCYKLRAETSSGTPDDANPSTFRGRSLIIPCWGLDAPLTVMARCKGRGLDELSVLAGV